MIHKYSFEGQNIVLDVNSGAVHIFDDLSYQMLDYLNEPLQKTCPQEVKNAFCGRFTAEDIEEAYSDIFELYKKGHLLSKDEYASIAEKTENLSPVKALCLHIAHDCNLRCEYCFAGKGDFNQGKSIMSAEVGKRAIDKVIALSEGRKNIEVDFFGGEPLLNFEVVKEIIEYAEQKGKETNKNFRFTITTNGVLLDDDIMNYINEHMGNVVLSIDGRPKVHDRLRKTINGKGSYDLIMPKFKQMAEIRKQDNYYVRGTFTHYNLDFSKDILHLADLGFKQISIEPAVSEEGLPYSITEDDLPKIFNEYENLARIIAKYRKEGKWFNFFHFMVDLEQGPCVIKRLRGCGSGNEYLAVTPDGDIYPCHQFVGMEEYKMGSVFEDGLNLEIKNKFAHQNVYSIDECKNCWAKFYCSGGCCANNVKYGGSLKTPHKLSCEMEKKRVECAIWLAADKLLNA